MLQTFTDILGFTQRKFTQFQTYDFKKKYIMKIFFLNAYNETNVAEVYCWAKTLTAWRSCCSRLSLSVLEFGFKMDSHVHTYLTVCVLISDLITCVGSSGK